MEDFIKELLLLKEINRHHNEDEIREIVRLNFHLSQQLLEKRLSNARILFTNSSGSIFSSLSFMFAATAVFFTIFNVILATEYVIPELQLLTYIALTILGFVIILLGFVFLWRFGSTFRASELEMRIIPWILDHLNSQNEDEV